MPLADIQGAVPGLHVTHAVIHAPGKVTTFTQKKPQEVDFYLFLKPLKLAPGMKSLASRGPIRPLGGKLFLCDDILG